MRRHSIRNGWRPLTAGGSPSESPRSESPGHRALTSIGRHVRSPTMNWHHREPTLDEILSDSIVRAVMEVDGVNPHELETMLRRGAQRLRDARRGGERPEDGGGDLGGACPEFLLFFLARLGVRTPLVDEGFQKLRRTPRRSASSPCVRSAPTITLKLPRDDCCVKSTGSTARSPARSGIPGRTAPARQARIVIISL